MLYLLTSGNNAIQSLVNSQKPLIDSIQNFTGNKPSRCFHPNTIIPLKNNTFKNIKDIKLNDVLLDGTIVEGTMILKNYDNNNKQINNLYQLFNNDGSYTLVTGKHLVYHNNDWIYVESHPKALLTVISSKIVYCLITNNHTITIKDYIFHDWEDNDGMPNKDVKM